MNHSKADLQTDGRDATSQQLMNVPAQKKKKHYWWMWQMNKASVSMTWTTPEYCSVLQWNWLTASRGHKTACLLDRDLAAHQPARCKKFGRVREAQQIWFHSLQLQWSYSLRISLSSCVLFSKHEKLWRQPNWTSECFTETEHLQTSLEERNTWM